MLFNIPIENLEERYSTQWNTWFPHEFKRQKIEYVTINGITLTNKIERGSFLDVCGTNYFKATQLMEISQMIHEGKVKDGDVFFFHDMWFPGLEALAYMRDGLGIDFKIFGILHAGTYDQYDFLAKQGMHYWGRQLEMSWLKIVDGVFVATHFHRNLIKSHRNTQKPIFVTGFPIYPKEFVDPKSKRLDIVVFPHRLDSEKNPGRFDVMKDALEPFVKNWVFIKTKDVCKTKKDYYTLLNRAKIAVSFADQETWGIAQQEALFCGCLPVVPNKLSYPELYQECFRYDTFEQALQKVVEFIEKPNRYKEAFKANRLMLRVQGRAAISKMLGLMGKFGEIYA